jgi:GT2 family glycosyltransferase
LPDLSIIIVNWNTKDLLLRCLQCVYDTAEDLDLEAIVIDNASRDGSAAAVRERFPGVSLIENETNLGFARGNNQGFEIARGRHLLLLNTDVFVHPGTLKTLVETLDTVPGTGAAGCKLFYGDGRPQRSAFAFPTLATELWQALRLDKLFPQSRLFGRYRMTYWDMEDSREVDSVLGACLILRGEGLRQVGGLDERFFMYSEEVDLCYRLKLAGWKVRYVPTATATHLWGESARKVPAETFLRLYRSRIQFFRKHYGDGAAWLFKLILLAGGLPRLIAGPLSFLVSKNERAKNGVRNYWRLVRAMWVY